jgi:hypothetical protein
MKQLGQLIPAMKRCFSIPAIVILLITQLPTDGPAATQGFQLPRPAQSVPTQSGDSLGVKLAEVVRLFLTIDSSGRVSGVEPGCVMTIDRLNGLRSYFSRVKFDAARKGKHAVRSRILVDAVLSSDTSSFVVCYPESDNSISEGRVLSMESLRLNDIFPAEWKGFPSFHATLSAADTSAILRYALIALDLDAKGKVTRTEMVNTNYPVFAHQVEIAANWGSYLPAKVKRKAVASTNFLLVSFFPTISYPTPPLEASRMDTSSWHQRYLLQLLPDSVGFMTVPVPHGPSAVDHHAEVPPSLARRTMVMRCLVDTVGKATLYAIGKDSVGTAQFCRKMGEQIRFFPATDFSGHARPFAGLVELANPSETIIRIRYLWLQ